MKNYHEMIHDLYDANRLGSVGLQTMARCLRIWHADACGITSADMVHSGRDFPDNRPISPSKQRGYVVLMRLQRRGLLRRNERGQYQPDFDGIAAEHARVMKEQP